MHTYGNLEYTKDEIDVGGASTSSYIHPYGYRATLSYNGEIHFTISMFTTYVLFKTQEQKNLVFEPFLRDFLDI